MLFGKKKPDARTLLLLDVENGSVGGALVRITDGEPPRLFAERRTYLPVRSARSAQDLFAGVRTATRGVLGGVSEVAARLRQHPTTEAVGEVERAAIFLSPPWGVPSLSAGKPHFNGAVTEAVEKELAGFFDISSSFYTSAGALFRGARHLLSHEREYMLCGVHGETSELLMVQDGMVAGHAVFPVGSHAVMRTLHTHGDFTTREARRLLGDYRPSAKLGDLDETFLTSANHFTGSFAAAAEPLFNNRKSPTRVYSVAHEGPDFFAKALSESRRVGELFPNGGTVRALRPAHAMPHLSAHAEHPDLWLMLEALFATAL